MMMTDPNNTHYNLHPSAQESPRTRRSRRSSWMEMKIAKIFDLRTQEFQACNNPQEAVVMRLRRGCCGNRQRRHIIEIIARHSRLGHKKYSREQQSLIHYIASRVDPSISIQLPGKTLFPIRYRQTDRIAKEVPQNPPLTRKCDYVERYTQERKNWTRFMNEILLYEWRLN